MSEFLLISDAAKEVRVETHVLRYWEEELHLPIKRNELGHRYYTYEDVKRFKQIKIMKEKGLQLKAIKMILKDGKLDVLEERDLAVLAENSLRNVALNEEERIMPISVIGEITEGGSAQEKVENGFPKSKEDDDGGCSAVEDGVRFISEKGGKETGADLAAQIGEGTAKEIGSNIVSAVNEQGREELDYMEGHTSVAEESSSEKSKRLQWLLQQLIRETLIENNKELCREIRDGVIKELDYQFRIQDEREEERTRQQNERSEEYYKKMDELLRSKSVQKIKRKHNRKKKDVEEQEQDREDFKSLKKLSEQKAADNKPIDIKAHKKKRHFIF